MNHQRTSAGYAWQNDVIKKQKRTGHPMLQTEPGSGLFCLCIGSQLQLKLKA
jgi:alpha-ketoglutarate-dependent taurine dioxygenase